jgi:two-component system cell cycle response regulator DivK
MGSTRKILFVEDDVLVARIYRRKLEDAGFNVLVAEDGLLATKLLKEFRPDLVVLDLLIPRLSGLDVLKFIRQDPELKPTRVVVFSNAFLKNLWEEVAALGVHEMLLKSSVTPPQLIETVSKILDQVSAPLIVRSASAEEDSAPVKTAGPAAEAASAAPAAGKPKPVHHNESAAEFRRRIRRDFFTQIPAISKGLDQACREFLESADGAVGSSRLQALRRKIGFLTHMTSMAGCYRIAQLSSAFEALLFELELKPSSITDSTRHTVSSTVKLLADGLARAEQPDEQCFSPTTVLVVEDDAVSSCALLMTLARANLAASGVPDPFKALEKLRKNSYDLVILDINLPGMSGLSLCEQMRKLPLHGKTPVIFVTSYAEFEPRARAILNAGDDLIGKPVMPVELTVKVIAHTLQRRLQSRPLPD